MSNQYNDLLVSQMTEPLDAERNAVLYARVAAGDTAAREEMIAGNMALAVAKVESFIRCFPDIAHLRDDLTSAAFTGLVKAVNQMARGCRIKQPKNWTPTDCIGAWINRELGELIDTENPVRLPPRSKYRARAEGRDLTVPTVCNVIPDRFETPSYETELETRDLIASCCTCEEERTVVAMREAGHTYAEIATAVAMPLSSTYAVAKRLGARVRQRLEAVRDE